VVSTARKSLPSVMHRPPGEPSNRSGRAPIKPNQG
jgi:hypothetical protein